MVSMCQMWWRMPGIPALVSWRQEEFKVSLS